MTGEAPGDTPKGYRAMSRDAMQEVFAKAHQQGILEVLYSNHADQAIADGVTEVWIEAGTLHQTVAGAVKA